MKPSHLDLFSGIGGFSLAFEEEGFETIGFSEIDHYACAVLNKHWPTVKNYGDVRNITKETVGSIDVLTGGFPCQPFSVAGARRGDSDERFLWPECVRILRELRPTYALFENVTGLLAIDGGRTFNRILSDISSVGYDCLWNCVPACAVGAPHRRDRIWILAHTGSGGLEQGSLCNGRSNEKQAEKRRSIISAESSEASVSLADSKCVRELQPQGSKQDEWRRAGDSGSNVSDTNGSSAGLERRQRQESQGNGKRFTDSDWWESEPELGRVAHGVSNRSHRIKCLGNGIVPKVAQIFAKEIYKNLKTYHG